MAYSLGVTGSGSQQFGNYGTLMPGMGTPAAATPPSVPSIASTQPNYDIAAAVNAFNRAQQQQANLSRIPGAAGLEGQSSANIASELSGSVPTDVLNMLGEQAAERGVSTGSINAPGANAAYLRALGLTSLDQQARGQQDLSAAYSRNPDAPLFDVSGYMSEQDQRAMQEASLREQEAVQAQNYALAQQQFAAQQAAQQWQQQMEQQKFALQQQQAAWQHQQQSPSYGAHPVFTPAQAPTTPSYTNPYGSTKTGTYGGSTATNPTASVPTMGGIFQSGPSTINYNPAGYGDLYSGQIPNASGFQPTSSGSMYMGDEQGYSNAVWDQIANPELYGD
jgi:hypothetical protein